MFFVSMLWSFGESVIWLFQIKLIAIVFLWICSRTCHLDMLHAFSGHLCWTCLIAVEQMLGLIPPSVSLLVETSRISTCPCPTSFMVVVHMLFRVKARVVVD
uniref:Uncharacterized protein n=1 Tax=Oryza brachyantha TaxID=4533 RepID=J3NEB1_ORYBR